MAIIAVTSIFLVTGAFLLWLYSKLTGSFRRRFLRVFLVFVGAGAVMFAVALGGTPGDAEYMDPIVALISIGAYFAMLPLSAWLVLRNDAAKPSHVRIADAGERGAKFRRPPGDEERVDVFISYKRDERSEVQAIVRHLQSLRINVWFDAELRSGTNFDAEIEQKVRAAKCVLVAWSPGAVASEWVRSEATIGRQRGVLAACVLKACDLPPPFNLVHAEDLRAGIGAHNSEWIRLLERIGALVDRPGLASYEAARADRAALAAWISSHPSDPLFDAAIAQLRS